MTEKRYEASLEAVKLVYYKKEVTVVTDKREVFTFANHLQREGVAIISSDEVEKKKQVLAKIANRPYRYLKTGENLALGLAILGCIGIIAKTAFLILPIIAFVAIQVLNRLGNLPKFRQRQWNDYDFEGFRAQLDPTNIRHSKNFRLRVEQVTDLIPEPRFAIELLGSTKHGFLLVIGPKTGERVYLLEW